MTFPDSHVKCPSCEAVVPWSPACINCGSRLPPQAPQNPFQAVGETIRRQENEEKAKEELVTTVTELSPEEKPEGRLAAYMLWRVKLLEKAERGEIMGEVFTELYSQYMDKTVELTQQYADIGDEVAEAHETLLETRRQLEERQEQRARGELSTQEFMAEFDRLRGVIDKVQRTINRLRAKRNELGLGGGTEEDDAKLSHIRSRLHSYSVRLPGLVAAGVMPAEMRDIIGGDLEDLLGIFENSVDWQLEPEPIEAELAEAPEPGEPEAKVEKDEALKEVTRYVKGHDDELKRILRAVRLHDNVLILGPDGEGKTETLLQFKRALGGVYLQCSEETTERELVAGFNPGAQAGQAPVHSGALVQVKQGESPMLYLDNVSELRPAAQALLLEAMNNKTFTNPVDGASVTLPEEFSVVAAATLDSHTMEAPNPAFLDRFGKHVVWCKTPVENIQALLARYALPEHVFNLATWVRQEACKMRYLAPVSVRNLLKFAKEYNAYRGLYQDEAQLKQLAVDRLLRMRVLNGFGREEYVEAHRRVMEYKWEKA
ncbi:MAG: MoxR family ATPase [Candidatus Bathyarchaeota archaeon]